MWISGWKKPDIIPITDFHSNEAIALDILDMLQHDGYIKYEMVDDDNCRIIPRIKYKFAKAISFERFFSLIWQWNPDTLKYLGS